MAAWMAVTSTAMTPTASGASKGTQTNRQRDESRRCLSEKNFLRIFLYRKPELC
jgi:hypothetical protein